MTRAARFSLNNDSVVVVIGSGASGAIVANGLAGRDVDVVCLEAGRRLSFADIVTDEAAMFAKLAWQDPRLGRGDAVAHFPVWTCKTVGGTTMHWTATSLRLQPHEMRAHSHYGRVPGATLADWPLGYDDLAPWYEHIERRIGVTGTHGVGYLPANNNYKVLAAGAGNIGYREITTNHLAINPRPRDGRPGCQQLGFCTSGCAIGAKWSALYTEIPAAEASGHFELRPQSMAVALQHDRGGRIIAVEYLDYEGRRRRQKARAVCVAGNVVETTRLLLNSRSAVFPGGLANSSGLLGRNYMRHIIAALVGEMPGPVNMHRGTHQAGLVADDRHHDPGRGFVGGVIFLTVPFTPEVLARLLRPGAWGRKITAVLERYDHLACLMLHGEDMPQADNRITLHPSRKDRYGLPIPVVHYTHHANAKPMLDYAIDRGRRMYRSLGAKRIHEMVNVFPATHNMGTARMGTDPAASVCNSWGQTHDIPNLFIADGSLFPSAGCENPTLTIMALAARQADYVYRLLMHDEI